MDSGPVVYVIRHRNGYALYPFTEHISLLLNPLSGTLTPHDVILATQNLPASLILDEDGGNVDWKDAGAITLEDLDRMATL